MEQVNTYLKSTDGNEKVTEHFKVREFACQDGCDLVCVSYKLALILENIRMHFNKPVIINSAFRTPDHNKKVGGSMNSKHQLGIAADIAIRGVTPKEVADYARILMPNFGGIGLYSTFTHIDVREKRTTWNG